MRTAEYSNIDATLHGGALDGSRSCNKFYVCIGLDGTAAGMRAPDLSLLHCMHACTMLHGSVARPALSRCWSSPPPAPHPPPSQVPELDASSALRSGSGSWGGGRVQRYPIQRAVLALAPTPVPPPNPRTCVCLRACGRVGVWAYLRAAASFMV
jgi:hypothetical protein